MSSGIDTSDLVLARYNRDGRLDTSFGTGGHVALHVGSAPESFDQAQGIAVQADGKIVVVGSCGSPFTTEQFVLTRFTPNGRLDTSFGTGGIVLTSFAVGHWQADAGATAVALEGDRIVVAGTATVYWSGVVPRPAGFTPFSEFAVARYDSHGRLDTSFGTGGRVLTSFAPALGGEMDQASGIAVSADGKIVVVGSAEGASKHASSPGGVSAGDVLWTSHIALARYDAHGKLDGSFGSGGKVLTDFPGSTLNQAAGVAVTADGAVVVAGSAAGRFALARYDGHGRLDRTFGTGGRVTTGLAGTSDDSASGLVLTPGGKIVVGGSVQDRTGRQEFALARYDVHGKLDGSFGAGGTVVTSFGGDDSAAALARAPDGKVVAAGSSSRPGGTAFALARYTADPPPQAASGIAGVALVGPVRPAQMLGVASMRPLPDAVITVEPAGGGAVLARVRTDHDGRFRIALHPGKYLLVPLPTQPRRAVPRGKPQTVTVTANRFTPVIVTYDSGIR
jgi:uncharacterized delta-60 repeat protein